MQAHQASWVSHHTDRLSFAVSPPFLVLAHHTEHPRYLYEGETKSQAVRTTSWAEMKAPGPPSCPTSSSSTHVCAYSFSKDAQEDLPSDATR